MDKNTIKKGPSESFNEWCDVAGNPAKLAAYCGVTAQAVSLWRKLVPAERTPAVSQYTGLSFHQLRPDLYKLDESAAA